MNNDNSFNVSENSMWICILFISIFSHLLNSKFTLLILFWLIIVIINGNTQRIYFEKYNSFSMFIRRSLYIIPLYLPLLLHFKINIITNNILIWSIIGLVIGFLFIAPKIKIWMILLSKENIELTNKQIIMNYITQWLMYSIGSIGEEIFFRAYIIGYVSFEYPILAIFLSTFTFFLNHFSFNWGNKFSFYDYIIQIFFGCISSCLFLITGSILPSIIVHLTYNSPHIIMSFNEYKYHYHNKSFKIL